MKYGMRGITVVLVIGGAISVAQTAKDGSPGDEPYTPTKLEWAAVELQAAYGINEPPIMVYYTDSGDGKTITCLVSYAPDVKAATLKLVEDGVKRHFTSYSTARRWTWLRLKMEESVVK